MLSFWDVLTILAFVVGLLGLFARYDLLVRKFIYHLYTPDLQLVFYPGTQDREDGGITTRTPDYYSGDKVLVIKFNEKDNEFCIPRKRLCYSEYTDDDTKFAISIGNSGGKSLNINPEFFVDQRILSPKEALPKQLREVDFAEQMEIQEIDLTESLSIGPKRKFDFREFTLDTDAKRSFSFVIDDNRVIGDSTNDYEVLLRVSVSIEASEFSIWKWRLPNNIGSIEYGPIEKTVTILN